MKTTSRSIAIAAVLALALAACAGDDADTAADEPSIEPADEAPEDEVESEALEADDAAGDGPATVAVDSTSLGSVLVDGNGMTLYMFDADEQGPSQCSDDCAANWPPLVTDGDPVAEGGADDGLLGTVERDDGSLQVTYDGWPLYHFIADQAPGDVEGQAVQDVWWVLDTSGAPLRDGAAADDEEDGEAEEEQGGGSGY